MKLKVLLERKLRVFDFDDTLASTNGKIHTTFESGKKKSLTPAGGKHHQRGDEGPDRWDRENQNEWKKHPLA